MDDTLGSLRNSSGKAPAADAKADSAADSSFVLPEIPFWAVVLVGVIVVAAVTWFAAPLLSPSAPAPAATAAVVTTEGTTVTQTPAEAPASAPADAPAASATTGPVDATPVN